MQIWLLLVFFVGYFFIATEHRWGVDKAAVALILGMVSWMIIAAFGGDFHSSLEHSVIEIAEILFFLLGAMTIVGIIDAHDGFSIITDRIEKLVLPENRFQLVVITCANYDHQTKYVLPVKPSPNLPNIQSIYLYPSTCLFEGTVLSEGRGTDKPFQVFGHPDLPKTLYAFTPNPNEGAKNSKHYGKKCYGWNLSGTPEQVHAQVNNRIQLKWIIQAYQQFPKKDSFFIIPKSAKMEESFFTKLAGNNELWQQIKQGKSEAQIRASWKPKLDEFKAIRSRYLLYPDFK